MIVGKSGNWTPAQPLKQDENYEWEVGALHDGEMIAKAQAPPTAEARFAILPSEKRDALANLREKFGRLHLVMGLAYAQVGLLELARGEFESLARENPGSALTRKMLASLTNPTH